MAQGRGRAYVAGIPTYPTRQGKAVHRVSRDRVAEQHGRVSRAGVAARHEAGSGWVVLGRAPTGMGG